jgi:hypothetical protein
MSDEAGTGPVDDAGEPWVRRTPVVGQRVPGIEEAQESTYVDKGAGRTSWYVPVLVGVAIGLVVTAIFAAVVVSTDSGGSSKEAEVGPGATATSSTTRKTTTTTSEDWWKRTTTTTAPAASSGTTPNTTAPPTFAAAVVPATPRATTDPAAPPYAQVPLPQGVSATLTNCAWQPTNGGQYEAAGTVTNGAATNHGWTLTMHWLQNAREIAQQTTVVPLTAGQSAPWSVTLAAPNPPADPFSCALTAA